LRLAPGQVWEQAWPPLSLPERTRNRRVVGLEAG
jgi:hypothetical protein